MALFKDTEDFSQLAPVLETANWATLKPTIDLVERQYLRDHVLGKTLYDSLRAAYIASTEASPLVPLTADQQTLLDQCRPAIAGIAASLVIPKLSANITSAGMTVSETETMKRAPMWMSREARSALMKEGLSYLDQLIDFLISSGSTYNWQDSPFATRVKACLVRTVEEMTAHRVDIGNSGWLLHRLRPSMLTAQDRVRQVLSDAAFDDLLTQVQAGTLTGANPQLIDSARSAIIHLAIARMATLNSITIDDDGVWSWQSATSGQVSGGPIPAKDLRLDRAVELYRQTGEEQLKELERIAKKLADADQFPLYKNSDMYVQPYVRGTTTPEDSSTFSSL